MRSLIVVKATFLQGNPIEREVFLRPPREFYCGELWKLKKTVYGLCDAARAWYLRVKDELIKLGVKMSPYDSALFSWKPNHDLEGLICVYVDDFLWCGTEKFKALVIDKLASLFLIGSKESGALSYIGLNIRCDTGNSGISVDQMQYASSLEYLSVSRDDICNYFLECYSDALFANLPGGGSQGGKIIMLKNQDGSKYPLYWPVSSLRR